MAIQSYSKISFGMIFFVMIFVITVHLTILDFKSVSAQQQGGTDIIEIKKPNVEEKDELVVSSNINLQNIPKTGILKVVGVINGEGFIKDIPLDQIDETKQKLKVNFVMNKDNEFVSASKPDEFFVCAYHLPKYTPNYNSLPYFDCDEGDLAGSDTTTISRLFKPTSQVYAKSASYYDMQSPSKITSFDTLGNDEYATTEDDYPNDNNNNGNKPVKVKIIVPMEDRKNAQKIKIMAMLKGQIKSEVIEDVQKEFAKIGGYTIERTFAFDRDTDMGPIQIGDRFHSCVIGQDLNPPEGSECEKQLIKDLDKSTPLVVR